MPYLTPKQIEELSKDLESDYGAQTSEDRRQESMFQRRDAVDTGQKPGDIVKRIPTGFPQLVVMQSFSLLTQPPFGHVKAPNTKSDERAETVEASMSWLTAKYYSRVWLPGIYDFVWAGRKYDCLWADPRMWSAERGYAKSDDESESEYLSRTKTMKSNNVPIRWRHADVRSTRHNEDEDDDIDQVVETLEMTARQIKQSYPDVNVSDYKDREMVKVYRYADKKCTQTVICGKGEPQMGWEWEHDMGINPYTYARAPLQAPLDKGMLSHGALYNTKDLLDMMDGLISDVNHNIKESVASPLSVYVSPDRPAGPLGEPMIDVNMGPRALNKFWIGEDAKRMGSPETNIDVFKLWSIARELTQTVAIAPVLLGLLGSDQSGVLYNTAAAFAAKQYGPATAALEESAKGIAKRLCRSVYKTLKEPVTFYLPIDGAYSKVELTPKEAMMWEDRIQVSIPLAVAENDNALAEQARLLTDKQNKLLSKRTAQSQLLKVADTFAENERIADEDIEDVLAPILAQMVQQALVDDLNDPGQGAAPETPFGARVFDALVQGGQNGKQGGGQVARSAANSVREGVPTNPYQTESQQLTPESALAP